MRKLPFQPALCSKKSDFENPISRETTKVLGKVQFLKSHFSRRSSIANSFKIKIKHIPLALAIPLVVDLSRHTKILVHLIFFYT